MRCFYHESSDAVGTCKSCGKGLCRACAVDMQHGLACKGHCESAVAELIALIQTNVQHRRTVATQLSNMRSNTYIQALFILALAIVLIATGLQVRVLLPYLGGISITFLGVSAFLVWRAVKLPR